MHAVNTHNKALEYVMRKWIWTWIADNIFTQRSQNCDDFKQYVFRISDEVQRKLLIYKQHLDWGI